MIKRPKLTAAILSAMMVFGMASLPSAVHAEETAGIFASGSGTQEEPYVISTADQLSSFATSVDEGTTYAGQYVKLSSDIDLSGIENWNPIGVEKKYNDSKLQNVFWGDFDGEGHSISNLNIENTYTEEADIGLFSILGNTARIHNIVLDNVNINATVDGDWVTVRAGGIAGVTGRRTSANASLTRTAVIDSCSVTGNVKVNGSTGQCYGGGVAGHIFTYGAVVNCISYAEVAVETSGSWNAAYAGGLAGMTAGNTVLENCVSFGSAKAINKSSTEDVYAGGMIGMNSSMTANNYAVGNATIIRKDNSDTKGSRVGVLAGQAVASAQGDLNYYNSSAVLLDENEDGESVVFPVQAWQEGEGTKVSAAIAKSPEELKSEEFLNTLNANVTTLNETAEDALKLTEWKFNENGEIVPFVVEKPIPQGDLNNDGNVDDEDIKVLACHIAKIETITDEAALSRADVNGDGAINAKDLTALALVITAE